MKKTFKSKIATTVLVFGLATILVSSLGYNVAHCKTVQKDVRGKSTVLGETTKPKRTFKVKGVNIKYTGKHDFSYFKLSSGKSIMYMITEDDGTISNLTVSVFDGKQKKFADSIESIKTKNHKHKDKNGNVYYTATHLEQTMGFFAFPGKKLVTASCDGDNWTSKDIIDNLKVWLPK